jgi:hypothetical protein
MLFSIVCQYIANRVRSGYWWLQLVKVRQRNSISLGLTVAGPTPHRALLVQEAGGALATQIFE